MRIEQVSLRTLTVGIVSLLAILAVLTLLLMAHFFRTAALDAQRQSLSRVVAVASQEVLRQLDALMFAFGTETQSRPAFRAALARYQQSGDATALQAALQDPFSHGFSVMGKVDLLKLRLYDTDLNLLQESTSGLALPSTLAPDLMRLATGRERVERLKAVSGMWASSQGVHYSVLLPIGGLRLMGYLEVVADPAFNLQGVAGMTGMPLVIHSRDGSVLYQSAGSLEVGPRLLPVEYVLGTTQDENYLRLVCWSDVAQLDDDLERTTSIAVAAVVGLIALAALIVLGIFNRFLFQPVSAMQVEMSRCAEGDLSVRVGRRMLREFSALADAFNVMAKQLAAKVEELNRLSRFDSLTGLANRHFFDLCIEKEWRRALRSRTPLSLLMIDVDYFKLYNDHYGHVEGDACLRAVANEIGKVVQRSTDLPARYGGEEFAVLLPEASQQSAVTLAEKLLAALQLMNMPHAASPLGRVSVSIGVASCCASEQCKPAGLISVADAALYEAKHAGRNRLEVAGLGASLGRCAECPGFIPAAD